jgi:HlyD family secretion protein
MDRVLEKKRFTPKKIITYASIGIILLLVLYSLIFGDKSSKLNVDNNKITIANVSKGPFLEFIPVIGNVIPITTIYLDATEGGKVDQKLLEAGSMVKKGDEILKFVNTDLQLRVMQQESYLFEALNNLRNSRLLMEQNKLSLKAQLAEFEYQTESKRNLFERTEALANKNMISKQDFEQAKLEYDYFLKKRDLTLENMRQDSIFRKNQVEQLEFSLKRMQTSLDIAKQTLENGMTVKAPISGQLTSLDAEIGQLKSAGSRLGQIDVLDSFKVRVSIDEHYIARINAGQKGEFDLSGNPHKLFIEKVYPEVKDGKFEVDMLFLDKSPAGIRRGQTLHIRLELGDLSEAILLPNGGFFQKTGGNWVYIVDKSEAFATKRQIRLGRKNPEYFEVLEGLQPGEKVITSSYDNFGENDKLILK